MSRKLTSQAVPLQGPSLASGMQGLSAVSCLLAWSPASANHVPPLPVEVSDLTLRFWTCRRSTSPGPDDDDGNDLSDLIIRQVAEVITKEYAPDQVVIFLE